MSTPIKRFYEFDNFLVDVENQTLLRNATPVPLKPKAFDTLRVLIENRGQVLSKDKLMDLLWPESDVELNNVDQQIGALRTALGGKFRNRERYIKTIWGQGFCFIAEVKVKDHSNSSSLPELLSSSPPPFRIQWKQVIITAVASSMLVGTITAGAFYFRMSGGQSANTIEPLVKGDKKDPGATWTAIVPPIAKGVPLEYDGYPFEMLAGDEIEVGASGIVDIGRGPFDPNGSTERDTNVDSKFKDRIGGLEMWIGPDKEANRYFIGSHFTGPVRDSGVPTFRVIESLHGYKDSNNSGAFVVTVRRLSPKQNKTQ